MEILLVEDNLADVELTMYALSKGQIPKKINVVEDGVEALAFLRRESPYQNAPRPDLIIMDLNLPRKNGKETLAEIRRDERIRNIPVAILSTSQSTGDIDQCYTLHANCYLLKPIRVGELNELLRAMEEFWFRFVKSPSASESTGHSDSRR